MHSSIFHIHVRILILIGNLLVGSQIEHKVIPIGLDQYLPLTTFYLREDHYDLLLMILCNNRCLFIKLSFFFVSSLNRILSRGIYFLNQFLHPTVNSILERKPYHSEYLFEGLICSPSWTGGLFHLCLLNFPPIKVR